MVPVKPGVLSRISSISRRIDGLRAALDDAPLVLGDRAEGAAAEAAAHDVDREADHVPGRDARLAVAGVRAAGVGLAEDPVHLLGGQRDRRRVEPHVTAAGAGAVACTIARALPGWIRGGRCARRGRTSPCRPSHLVGRQADHLAGAVGLAGGDALAAGRCAPVGNAGGSTGSAAKAPSRRGSGGADGAGAVDQRGVDLDQSLRATSRPDHEGGAAQVADG